MWTILHTIVFSIIIIIVFHYTWNYIKDTYSTKRTKDLVGFQTEKYKSIVKEIIENRPPPPEEYNTNTENSSGFLNQNEKKSMDDDLTSFMQEQLYLGNSSSLVNKDIPLQITL